MQAALIEAWFEAGGQDEDEDEAPEPADNFAVPASAAVTA